MPIIVSDKSTERGKKDARRHRDKQRDAIRKKVPEIIAEESIITQRKGKTIRIPIRGIQIPDFRPGQRKKGEGEDGGGAGIGQGKGRKGDVLGKRPGQGTGEEGEGAGTEPGEHVLETEVEIEELIEMMLEDLGLPNLQQKDVAEIEVMLGFRLRGINKSGPWPLLDRRRTGKEGIKRFFGFLEVLKAETGRDELACAEALSKSEGDLGKALAILADPTFIPSSRELEPFPVITNEDLRYHRIRENITHQSNAVFVAMMDRSGSMTTEKKYLARAMLFWIVEFLRKLYDHVEVRFIAHDTKAFMVPEENFFKVSNSGGTNCSSAYALANSLVDDQYSTKNWNAYVFHFSDGDNYPEDNELCVQLVQALIAKGVNMVGYGEIIPGDEHIHGRDGAMLYGGYRMATLYEELTKALKASPSSESKDELKGLGVAVGGEGVPFLALKIHNKAQLLPAIKEFLKKDRWAAAS